MYTSTSNIYNKHMNLSKRIQIEQYLMEHKTMECVCQVFDYLKDTLGYDMFYDLFKCILTDNGYEFSNPEYIENNDYEILKLL